MRRLKIRIKSFIMWWLFNEPCTCDENSGCYICSDHFNLLKEIFDRIDRMIYYL